MIDGHDPHDMIKHTKQKTINLSWQENQNMLNHNSIQIMVCYLFDFFYYTDICLILILIYFFILNFGYFLRKVKKKK